MVTSADEPERPAVYLNQPAHFWASDSISNCHVKDLNVRIRFLPLFPQDFQYTGDGFPDIALDLIDRLALGIAAGEGWHFSPETTIRFFMDDHCVALHFYFQAPPRAVLFKYFPRPGFPRNSPPSTITSPREITVRALPRTW